MWQLKKYFSAMTTIPGTYIINYALIASFDQKWPIAKSIQNSGGTFGSMQYDMASESLF